MTPFPMIPLSRQDIEQLAQLRSLFLEEPVQGTRDYWTDMRRLELYDATFGRRIAWKWEAVCGELTRQGWRGPAQAKFLVDWGCGSGVASEVFLRETSLVPPLTKGLYACDRSSLATRYTLRKADIHNLSTYEGLPTELGSAVFLLSHVLTELPDSALSLLMSQLQRSAGFVWVEPGSHLCSSRLIQIRKELIPTHRVVAPCTHQAPCPLQDPQLARHWCHNFAHPPHEIFHASEWSRFSKEFGIDLRALPVSFLAMEARLPGPQVDAMAGRCRVIGSPRRLKGHARLFTCDPSGFHDRSLPFKSHAALLEELEEAEFEMLLPGWPP